MNILYTVGYCTFSQPELVELLKKHQIGALVDVRAWPRSRSFPEYNDSNFKPVLNQNGIYYLSLGKELGARPEDPRLYSNGQVDFEKQCSDELFLGALRRLRAGLDKFNLCLMCAQKDPGNCHRGLLITPAMQVLWPDLKIIHLWPGEKLETQKELDKRILKNSGLQQGELFGVCGNNYQETLINAYKEQFAEIAWRREEAKA